MEETQKLQKFHFFFWFLNLHNLLERVYPYKFQNTLNYFLMHQKKKKKRNWPKWKILYFFLKIDIPEVYVWLFENFENLIALQFWCLIFPKNFEWLANGTVLGQSNPNSSWGKICKNCKIDRVNHISCVGYLNTV